MRAFLLSVLKLSAWVVAAMVLAGCDGDVGAGGLAEQDGDEESAAWEEIAEQCTRSFIANYWDPEAHYFRYGNQGNPEFHYWPQAHALDVLLDAYERTDDPFYREHVDAWFDGVYRQNGGTFLKEYYDDMQWNALAMLRAFEITGDGRFRAAVDTVWEEIETGWTPVAGGGIMWSKGTPTSKNAISNAPASLLASRLYRLTGDASYLGWATKTLAWQKERLIDPETGAVWDHVVVEDGVESIRKNWIFTYNQGMYLAASHALYGITGDTTYLADAIQAADYALEHLSTDDGLLKSEGGGDGGLFKGIFVRYLAQLILEDDLPAEKREAYTAFLLHNARTLWDEGTNRTHLLFGPYWKHAPADDAEIDLTVQLSGTMLLEAAALVEN